MSLSRAQLAALAVAIAVVCIGKHVYRDASAGELRAFLAPTAKVVSLATGSNFVYESGQGWIDRDVGIIIEPACAGVNFALAAFCTLVLGWLAMMTTWRVAATRLALALGVAYVATIVVNTIRIIIAIRLHGANLRGIDPGDVHQVEGIVVYLGGLCALYATAKRQRHAWFAVPIAAYLVITLALPIANGAAARAGFVRHAAMVLAGCVAVVGVALVVELVRNRLQPRTVGDRT